MLAQRRDWRALGVCRRVHVLEAAREHAKSHAVRPTRAVHANDVRQNGSYVYVTASHPSTKAALRRPKGHLGGL